MSLDHEQRLGLKLQNLPAEFRADGAARSCHSDTASCDQFLYRCRIKAYGSALQQVFEGEVPDLAHGDFAVQNVAEIWKRCDWNFEWLQGRHDFPELLRGGPRHGDKHFVNLHPVHDGAQVLSCSQHRNAVDPVTHFIRIVVDESDGVHLIKRIVPHVPDNHLARVAGPVDENSFFPGIGADLPPDPAREPDAGDEDRKSVV